MTFVRLAAVSAAALVATALASASDTATPRMLTGIAGPGGCVAQANVDAPRGAGLPKASDCAEGRGLRQVHHVALSPDERFLYAASGANLSAPDDDGSVTVFRRKQDGSVVQLAGASGCVKRPNAIAGQEGCGGARGLEGGARILTTTSDGLLYVGGLSGIASFHRDEKTGMIRQLAGGDGCLSDAPSLPCRQTPGMNAIEDLALTKDRRFLYVVSNSLDAILVLRRGARGSLIPVAGPNGCLARAPIAGRACRSARGLNRARALTLSPDERFGYLAAIDDTIAVFKRDSKTGALRQLPGTAGCISETGANGCTRARGILGPHRLTITRDGRFAYLAGKQDESQGRGSAVAVFRRSVLTGALTQLPGTAGCITEDGRDGCAEGRVILGAHAVTLDPTETMAYISSDRTDNGGIGIYARNPLTGVLTQPTGMKGCIAPTDIHGCTVYRRTGGIHFVVVSRDGRHAYAAGENQYAVLAFKLER